LGAIAKFAATAGRDVLVIDSDEQQTAITFTELRSAQLGQPGYTAVSLQGSAIRTQVHQLAPKYDDIVIDVGGRDTGSLHAALIISNTFLIPVLPRSFDIRSPFTRCVAPGTDLNPDHGVLQVEELREWLRIEDGELVKVSHLKSRVLIRQKRNSTQNRGYRLRPSLSKPVERSQAGNSR
jgi:cellulose biosynthesis protein BcsQ